ncbi:uncharacterized protein [Procambarus clarkii]|uniref:uncharacterized protein isoform X2 n=1 Tax=Procambarus clarkii TaxID=6728 RepID=UPI0037448C37
MLRFVTFLAVTLLASASPASRLRILEPELTVILQDALAPYDPLTIESLTDLHVVTSDADVLYNAVNTAVTGLSEIVVNNFSPPIPLISKAVKIETTVTIDAHSDDYSIAGTFQGADIAASGVSDLRFNGLDIIIHLKADSYTLLPFSLCVQEGSLSIELSVASIDSALEGAGGINDEIEANGPVVLELVANLFNENSAEIETILNNALCV